MVDAKTRAERVGEWRASGLSAAKFCEGRDFKAHALWNWASKMRKGEQQSGRPEPAKVNSVVRLARVIRVARPAVAARPVGVALSVELWGVRVVVPPGFDRQTLAAVLAEIEGHGRTGAGTR
jgi:transposase